jgi:hypothetical protein
LRAVGSVVRAPASHAGGQRFKSSTAHHLLASKTDKNPSLADITTSNFVTEIDKSVTKVLQNKSDRNGSKQLPKDLQETYINDLKVAGKDASTIDAL